MRKWHRAIHLLQVPVTTAHMSDPSCPSSTHLRQHIFRVQLRRRQYTTAPRLLPPAPADIRAPRIPRGANHRMRAQGKRTNLIPLSVRVRRLNNRRGTRRQAHQRARRSLQPHRRMKDCWVDWWDRRVFCVQSPRRPPLQSRSLTLPTQSSTRVWKQPQQSLVRALRLAVCSHSSHQNHLQPAQEMATMPNLHQPQSPAQMTQRLRLRQLRPKARFWLALPHTSRAPRPSNRHH